MCAVIPVAGQRTHGTGAYKVTPQVAARAAGSAVYDCLVFIGRGVNLLLFLKTVSYAVFVLLPIFRRIKIYILSTALAQRRAGIKLSSIAGTVSSGSCRVSFIVGK